MPIYDILCPRCGHQQLDVLQRIECKQPTCPDCDTQMERAWLSKPPGVIGDECDVWVRHGICNPDGTPRRYRSKSEMHRAGKEKGLINRVEHISVEGHDKSPHTTRWV